MNESPRLMERNEKGRGWKEMRTNFLNRKVQITSNVSNVASLHSHFYPHQLTDFLANSREDHCESFWQDNTIGRDMTIISEPDRSREGPEGNWFAVGDYER